ncbi:Uncharacterized protein DAT39_006778 [Clarias magur]|uniref:Uncharacterized protein n=1 Tax=Clarias magur TaxID=1594786 RepID=A0A8J4U3P9_CLAMG|nr:Uncharacterized protein DAT39_006778 [Clarias magur]
MCCCHIVISALPICVSTPHAKLGSTGWDKARDSVNTPQSSCIRGWIRSPLRTLLGSLQPGMGSSVVISWELEAFED